MNNDLDVADEKSRSDVKFTMDKYTGLSFLGTVRIFSVHLSLVAFMTASALADEIINERTLRQIQALQAEKASRSAIHRKLDSPLVFELKRQRGQAIAAEVTELRSDVVREADGRVMVDIKATVSPPLLNRITRGGGSIVHSSPRFQSIRAQVRLEQLEELAGAAEVKFLQRASRAFTHAGSVNSEGDAAHGANLARSNFGVRGKGVKVGVLSDGIGQLAYSQENENLGPVTILPFQAGPLNASEGTAMLEIIHDLAPEAELYFATAFNGQASFAENILNLRSNGCDIIVDDVFYSDEPIFQDGIIAQAIGAITADGALYFSAAGNDGNLKYGSSGTWEGDFVDGGQSMPGFGGKIHSFGATNRNTILAAGNGVELVWADPAGASTNDYDLFLVNGAGDVVSASNNAQSGTQDSYEQVSYAYPGVQVVVVKSSGAPRFLHLQVPRGRLNISTSGATHGHSTATNAISVAAANAATSFLNSFSDTNRIESFSSDGPRRMFFQADGSPITAGNFSASGGKVRVKPDITAADGVATSIPGFQPFLGTSAAAPHAAAIAALLWSYEPSLSAAQVKNTLFNTALDTEEPGFDVNSGAGIVMADLALATRPPKPILVAGIARLVDENCPNTALDPGETVTVAFSLTNIGPAATANLVGTLLNTGGVSLASAQSFGVLGARGGTSSQTYGFRVDGSCGDTVVATLELRDGATHLGLASFTLRLGAPVIGLSETFDALTSPALPAGWSVFSPSGSATWRITNFWSNTPKFSAGAVSPGTSDQSLISPRFQVLSTNSQISFWQHRAMLFNYVGGVLEISTNGTVFQDILAAGGTFVTNGYNGLFETSNPPTNRPAWTGYLPPRLTTVNLPPSAAGKLVRLRWRFLSGTIDNSPPSAWYIDSVIHNDGMTCCNPLPNDIVMGAVSRPGSALLGENISYELKVRNTGPDNATGLFITNRTPSGFVVQSISIPQDITVESTNGNSLVFSLPTLPGGAVRTLTISGMVNVTGLLTNNSIIARADGGLATVNNVTVATSVTLPVALLNDVALLEGDFGTTDAIFSVRLTKAPATNASVRFATANQSALAGRDYFATNGVLTFAPGETNQSFAVRIIGNLLNETSKTFAVNLSFPTNLVIEKALGIGTILNEDPLPYLGVSDVTLLKPNSGTANATFNAGLSSPSGQSVSLLFSVGGGSAIAGVDFVSTNGTLTFAPGQTNLPVRIAVTNHVTRKPSQNFYLDLYAVQNAKVSRRGLCTILTALPGQLDHFSLDTAPSPASNGVPFSVTVTGRDYFESLATNVTGSATLQAFSVEAFRTNTLFDPATAQSWYYAGPGSRGYAFTPKTNMLITHFRLFTESDSTVSLWKEDGTLLAQQTGFVTNYAWVERPLAVPVVVLAGQTYRLSAYFSGPGGYLYDYQTDYPEVIMGQKYYRAGAGFPTGVDETGYRSAVDIRYLVGIPTAVMATPASAGSFSNSAWSGSVTVQLPATNVALMASDGTGHIGISQSFDVVPAPGQITHFMWDFIAALQPVSNAFGVQLTALDFFNQPVRNYAGSAGLTAAIVTPGIRTNTMLGNVFHSFISEDPDYTFGYSFTPKTNLTVTYFRHYFGDKVSLWTDSGTLLASRTVLSTPGFWRETPLLSPVQLVAGQTYRLGAHSTGQHHLRSDMPTNFVDYAIRQSYYVNGDAFPQFENSPKWDFVDLRYTVAFQLSTSVAITPTNSGVFTDGTWSGAILVNRLGTNLFLLADDRLGHKGTSNPFNVVSLPMQSPQLLGTALETGAITFRWSAVPGRTYQIQYSTNLNQAVWVNITPALTATNGNGSWSGLIESDPQRFYRVQIIP